MGKFSLVIPWGWNQDSYRTRALSFVTRRYHYLYPQAEIILGRPSRDTAFNRSEAILEGASRATTDIVVAVDADSYVPLDQALRNVGDHGWALPHRWMRRLSATSTYEVLTGNLQLGPELELSQDNPRDSVPYRASPTGTAIVIERDLLFAVPPDVRFVGWGQEDTAWNIALVVLQGRPWKGDADLYHLWHPEPERQNRVIGSEASKALLSRYQQCRQDRGRMRALVDESKGLWNAQRICAPHGENS